MDSRISSVLLLILPVTTSVALVSDTGPVDLYSLNSNWTGDIIKLWLEFTTGAHTPSSNVRIGWVKLTE